MKTPSALLGPLLSVMLVNAGPVDAGDWPAWRGPTRNNVAMAGQRPPVTWNENEQVLWKVNIPGRGHSSPIIVGDQILVTTADEEQQVQSVLSFDRLTGTQQWRTEVVHGGLPERIHKNNTHATPTLAWNGERLLAVFNSHEQVQLAALDLNGRKLWQIAAGGYRPERYHFGYAASPLTFESLVIVASEYEQGWLAAFDQADGREVWRVDRPDNTSYSSPIVAHLAGRDQLLMSGNDRVMSYDPRTGRELWSAVACTKATCGTLVWDGDLVFASGGFPGKETAAVRADGSGDVVWRNRESCYEQSLLAHEGYVYAVNDNGIAFCWRASDGEEMWKQRLSGPISASPVLADGKIYATNERGTTFVFHANPDEYQPLARNQLGDETYATPVIHDGRIYLRVAHHQPTGRVEMLYCLGTR